MERRLSYDPVRGVATDFIWQDGGVVIRTRENVQPVIDANTRAQADGVQETDIMRLKARIPPTVYHEWLIEAYRKGIPASSDKFKELVRKKLADSDWRKCLAYHGRVPFRVGYR